MGAIGMCDRVQRKEKKCKTVPSHMQGSYDENARRKSNETERNIAINRKRPTSLSEEEYNVGSDQETSDGRDRFKLVPVALSPDSESLVRLLPADLVL
jgi:hypothetical protein